MNLQTIQQELKAPKSNFNSFGKYSYRSCEDILEAVKPLLGESTLVLSDEIVEVGGRVYVKAEATFTDGDKIVKVHAFAREAEQKKGMDEAQITGSASSYARKYALNGLFLIDDTKDADTQDNSQVLFDKIDRCRTIEEVQAIATTLKNPDEIEYARKKYKELQSA